MAYWIANYLTTKILLDIYSGKYRNAGFSIQLFPALIVIKNQAPIDLLYQISTKELFLEFTQ